MGLHGGHGGIPVSSQQAWGSEFVKQQQDMDSGGEGYADPLLKSSYFLLRSILLLTGRIVVSKGAGLL